MEPSNIHSDGSSSQIHPDDELLIHEPDGEILRVKVLDDIEWMNGDANNIQHEKQSTDKQQGLEAAVVQQLVKEIHDGFAMKPEMTRKNRPPSLHILNDGRLRRWPKNDGKCVFTLQDTWLIDDWIENIKCGQVKISAYSVVICLDGMRLIEGDLPLRNRMAALCRAIKSQEKETRIYVSDNLPRPNNCTGLAEGAVEHNLLILSTAQKINGPKMLKVFPIEMSAYFEEENNEDIMDYIIGKSFQQDDTLTSYGCMIFRAQLFKEIGLDNAK